MVKCVAMVIVATAALAACSDSSSRTGGPTVTRNYKVGNFQEVELAGSYDVEIRTGKNVSVSAEGPENMLNALQVEANGTRLTVRPESQSGWFHFGRHFSRERVHLVVTVPRLTSATLAGSGAINIDHLTGGNFEGTVSGSGNINITTVDVQSLKLSIEGSGSAKAGQGRAQTAEFDIAGSGSVQAAGVQSQQLKVSIAGSGGVQAHATSIATVDIMGSGDVNISGGAKCTINKAGSGRVHCS